MRDLRLALTLVGGSLLAASLACGPQVPSFPRGSAASYEAVPGPLPTAAIALRADPPFDDGGLADAAAPAGHHHHHGGPAP
jgi:hypothetical protein